MYEEKKRRPGKNDDVNKVKMTQLVVWVCVGVETHELTFSQLRDICDISLKTSSSYEYS